MKRTFLIVVSFLAILGLQAQTVFSPNVAIKPMAELSVYKVELTDSETNVTVRFRSDKDLKPFTLKTKDLVIKQSGDGRDLKLIRWDKAPFSPETKVFSTPGEIFDFTLTFEPLPRNTKYFDIVHKVRSNEFYIQGIILDPEMNRLVTKGFNDFSKNNLDGALEAFTTFAEKDLYFEYGMAYFNTLYILSLKNDWKGAQVWYDKFKERYFQDKQLLEKQLEKMGIKQNLK
jgi:hypothetical protein